MFTGDRLLADRALLIDDGHITDIVPAAAVPTGYRLETLPPGGILAPGFVDLQVNGGGGVLLNGRPDAQAMALIAAAHRPEGTTALLPTLISSSRAVMAAALDGAAAAIRAGTPGIVGLHLEGPFLDKERCGIHPPDAVRVPDETDLALLCQPFPGPLLITVSPNIVTPPMIRRLVAAGRIVFAGHTGASYETCLEAAAAGLSGFTHLFNAMPPLAARSPGPVAAALDLADSFAGVIADGHHVFPPMLGLAIKVKGSERILLVSDAMASVGGPDHFYLGSRLIRLTEGRLTDEAGTLAGAQLTMAAALRFVVTKLGVSLASALRMATATPAAAINSGHRLGWLLPGRAADLVVLSAALDVQSVWMGGRMV